MSAPDKPFSEWTVEEIDAATPAEVSSAMEEEDFDEGLEDFRTIKVGCEFAKGDQAGSKDAGVDRPSS